MVLKHGSLANNNKIMQKCILKYRQIKNNKLMDRKFQLEFSTTNKSF